MVIAISVSTKVNLLAGLSHRGLDISEVNSRLENLSSDPPFARTPGSVVTLIVRPAIVWVKPISKVGDATKADQDAGSSRDSGRS